MPKTYEPISTQTLGSNQSSITISSIPQTYTDLIIVANGASTSGGSMTARFNGDTGSNYSTTYVFGDGASVTSSRLTNSSVGIFGSRNGGYQGGGVMQINNYANATTFKTMMARQFGSNQIQWFSVGLWRNTAAITSIVFSDEGSGSFTTGFTLTLYGIKAA
jgi:hypothetical protein